MKNLIKNFINFRNGLTISEFISAAADMSTLALYQLSTLAYSYILNQKYLFVILR